MNKALIVLATLIIIALLFSMDETDATPMVSAPAVQAPMMDSRIAEEIANSIGAGTTASLTDTATAHPKPARSMLEIAAMPLTIFCSVAMMSIALSGSWVLYILARNQERVAATWVKMTQRAI